MLSSKLDAVPTDMLNAEIRDLIAGLGEGKVRGMRRKVETAARVALVKLALGALPERQDPEGLVVPDSL